MSLLVLYSLHTAEHVYKLKEIIYRENVDRSRPIIAYNDLDFPDNGDIF